MGDSFQLILGLVIGGLFAPVVVRFLFVRVDEVSARFDELCTSIISGADVGADYWCRGAFDSDLKKLEAKIHGFQSKTTALFILFNEKDWSFIELARDRLDNYLDNLTGGEFEGHQRPANFNQAKDVQIAAAELIVHLRKYRRSRWFPF